jgi:hypothetical protein
VNDFRRDDDWQRSVRGLALAPFYGKHSREGRYVFIEKSRWSMLVQKRMAVDTVMQSKRGGSVAIEEKLTRPPKNGRRFVNFFLETQSCTVLGRESEGWMRYGEADFLLYCFVRHDGGVDGHAINFQKLKAWFWRHHERYRIYTMPKTINRTRGRLVPIRDVHGAVPAWHLPIAPVGTIGEALL